jgi:outer membrane murein-binding lipoprotein Lpp
MGTSNTYLNGGMARRIVEPLIVAAIVGALVMYGTVKILETKMDAICTSVNEVKIMVKDDVRDMTEMKAEIAGIKARQNRDFDTEAWERRKR